MIRDLTKSTISFSWAMSLLGMRQALNLFRSGQQRGGNVLGPVTQATVDQLDDSMKGVFRSGDNLQARAIDLAFASLNPSNWINPGNWMRSAVGQQGGNGSQPNSNGGQGNGQQSYQNGMGQQSWQTGTRSMGQQGQGAADAVLSFLNPFSWLNPNTWMGGGSSGGNCGCGQTGAMGQAGAAMGQAGAAMSQAMGQAASMFTQPFASAAGISDNDPRNPGNPGAPAGNSSAAAGWGSMPGGS